MLNILGIVGVLTTVGAIIIGIGYIQSKTPRR